MSGIMSIMDDVEEKGIVVTSPLESAVVDTIDILDSRNPEIILPAIGLNLGNETYDAIAEEREIKAIGEALITTAEIIDRSVPPVKRGQSIDFLDSQNMLEKTTGIVVAFEKLPIPNDYVVVLVQTKHRFFVVVHKFDWLRMGDSVRSVENDAMDEVTTFLEKRKAQYLSISSVPYGGMKGFSTEYAANRVWKPIAGRKIKAMELF